MPVQESRYAAIGGNVLINEENVNNGAYSGGSIILTVATAQKVGQVGAGTI